MISGGLNGGEVPFQQGFIVGALWALVGIGSLLGAAVIGGPVALVAGILLGLAGLLIDKDDKGYFMLGKLLGAATVLAVFFAVFLIIPIAALFWVSFGYLAITVLYYGIKALYNYLTFHTKRKSLIIV
ncbi:hypothetical protein [Acinetobacter towneri]|uniref:hypothetical protein n=1 Tax=Acinetobacter towneri TaxID=202956 RepID=UPI0020972972|nr:hypothetical protein [Acinetobacter towneri]MCO8060374.1 hypothetical protein [Acinetobacter towneri]MCO8066025.1 hypothetical protein [Acinetobacter towneri]